MLKCLGILHLFVTKTWQFSCPAVGTCQGERRSQRTWMNSFCELMVTGQQKAGRGFPRLWQGRKDTGRSFWRKTGFKCPICSKSVASDEMEMHFIMCLSKPRLSYNDDVLTKDAGECVICLEELLQGDTIARLPCLCIYHKSCIDSWFEVNRSCPEHPAD
uniref:E3 ubiquitin-protein ligase ZNRF1 n=1 Tax=Bos mutus grunniens TaxID=30521 RepID=A0A8B9XM12_BOSMU